MASRAGFVSILGRPNAGKSTLLNALCGEKLAIVARKPQTTRTTIQGVLNVGETQVVFLDTPGIHKSDNLFNKRMMETIRGAVEDRDLILFVVDAAHGPNAEDAEAISVAKRGSSPVILVLNKIDKLESKEKILQRITQYKELHEFDDYIPVSAMKKDGLEELKKLVMARMPENEHFFPPDYITDVPERFMVAELVREKILKYTQQEVPHSVAVLVEKWEDTSTVTKIYLTIYVEREGQKRIIVGKGGELLKKVGTEARLEAEKRLDLKIFLQLFVKVKPNWREDPQFLNEIDWRSMAGL